MPVAELDVIGCLRDLRAIALRAGPLSTGFQSNPQDYLETTGGRALVSRWGENPLPGTEPFDAGGDLLVLDVETPAIVGSIALPRPDDFPPRPADLTLHHGLVLVTLQRAAVDVKSMGEAMIVGVDPGAGSVVFSLSLDGLKNCGKLAISPGGERGAIACSSYVAPSGEPADITESAVVLLDVENEQPVELTRFAAVDVAGTALQSDVAFFSETGLLVKTQTALGGDEDNRLLALDLETGVATELARARAQSSGGQGVVYGELLCTPGCGDTCLMADADQGVLSRWAIAGGELEELPPLVVKGSIGLPPRDLGTY